MIGIVAAAALLLAVAGWGKLRNPAAAARALVGARLAVVPRRSFPWLIRLAGAWQLAVAGCVVVIGGPLAAAALAVTYGALTAISWRMAVVAPDTGCGCFGASEAPADAWHVTTNALLTAAALVAVAVPAPSLLGAVLDSPALAVPLLLASATLGYACYLLMTVLPALLRSRSQPAALEAAAP